MAGGKDVYRESSDATQEALNGIKAGEVNLDGALRDAKNFKPDWEGMARVERGRSPGRGSVETQSAKVAIQNGKKLAKLLVGYTTEAEQKQVINIIKGTSYEDILYLIKGYTEDMGFGSYFIEQIYLEDGFEEKIDLIQNVIGKLAQYASAHNYKGSASFFNQYKGRLSTTSDERMAIRKEYVEMARREGIDISFGM